MYVTVRTLNKFPPMYYSLMFWDFASDRYLPHCALKANQVVLRDQRHPALWYYEAARYIRSHSVARNPIYLTKPALLWTHRAWWDHNMQAYFFVREISWSDDGLNFQNIGGTWEQDLISYKRTQQFKFWVFMVTRVIQSRGYANRW